MHPHSKSEPVSWPLRIFSPWLVATLGGFAIGTALINLDRTDFPPGFESNANRAATYDGPLPASALKVVNEEASLTEESYEPAPAAFVSEAPSAVASRDSVFASQPLFEATETSPASGRETDSR